MNKNHSIIEIDKLLTQIEQGDVPLQYIISRLLEVLVKLNEKERRLEELLAALPGLSDLNRKISEIHTLHFPAKELKKKTMHDRLLAQVLLGPTRKM